MKLTLNSLSDTEEFARKMAKRLQGRTMTITLDGDLGAGKTAWTRYFGKALGVKRTINSPTFTIMKSYRTADGSMLYHMDAYRLEGAHQDLGFEECFEDGLCVVEWADYIAEQIPADHIAISIKETGETSRDVTLEATGPNAQAVLEGWE
ncbi:MAG: tRNA (adenosine(37)-N6)-threonylcarbamoyltransferase complex ATPase subunit type 1 TsaE [Allobaculum sp.]